MSGEPPPDEAWFERQRLAALTRRIREARHTGHHAEAERLTKELYAPASPGAAIADAELTRAQREANARSAALEAADARAGLTERDRDARPVAKALQPSVQAAAGLRVERLKILKVDVPLSLPRATPMAAFMACVVKTVAGLQGWGVSARCVEATARAIVILERKRGGFAWAGLKAVATVAGYCARHVQRAVRALEAHGLLDILNVPHRVDDAWWRDANIYVPTMDAEPPPLPADVDAPDPVAPASASRALGAGARLAALFGLVLRAGGLNTSPASNYRTNPTPA